MEPQYERERRFLVVDQSILEGQPGDLIVQAYLFSQDGYVVRVRRSHRGGKKPHEKDFAMLALKGPRYSYAREEYEMEIPPTLAAQLIRRASCKLSKTRYPHTEPDGLWDVDVFHGDNEGLIIAEIEMRDPSRIRVPDWCGAEITGDPRYNNENLASHPYATWEGS